MDEGDGDGDVFRKVFVDFRCDFFLLGEKEKKREEKIIVTTVGTWLVLATVDNKLFIGYFVCHIELSLKLLF